MKTTRPEKESQARAGIGGTLLLPLRYVVGGLVGVLGLFAVCATAAAMLGLILLRVLGEMVIILVTLFMSFGRSGFLLSILSSSRAQDIFALFWWGYGIVLRVASFSYAISLSFFKV